jgi:hypothetical protein
MSYTSFTYDTANPPESDEYKKVRVGVFFDGTYNNRKNTNAREAYFWESVNGAEKDIADLKRALQGIKILWRLNAIDYMKKFPL